MRQFLAFLALSAAVVGSSQSLLPAPKTFSWGANKNAPVDFQLASQIPDVKDVYQAFLEDALPAQSMVTPPTKLEVVLEKSFGEEEYRLEIGKSIKLKASTKTGVAWGLSMLSQMIDRDEYHEGVIQDSPDTKFRAVSLDVARRYHSPATLRRIIRACQIAKIRFIQLHLTDDQNWMLPTDVIPGIDKRNSSGHPAYTKVELKELINFGLARGVTLYPEIDLPGHSTLLVASDPELFGLKGSASRNCVNFGSQAARAKLKKLIAETCQLFSASHYIHLGGDEAYYPDASSDPEVKARILEFGPGGDANLIFVQFIGELCREAINHNKTPIVWEGFGPSELAKKAIPAKTIVVAWENAYYPADQLTKDGYTTINAGWDPNYVVNHYPYDAFTLVPMERLYKVDPKRFGLVNPGYKPVELTSSIGSLMCWWEGWEWNTQKYLPSRLFAFGAKLWNAQDEVNYQGLMKRQLVLEKILNERCSPMAVEVKGNLAGAPNQFTDKLILTPRVVRLGKHNVAMAKGGKTPEYADLMKSPTIELDKSAIICFQAFAGSQKIGDPVFFDARKVKYEPSLTTKKNVTVTGETDPQFPASKLVDGVLDDPTSYWHAYPNPQSATVDLGGIKKLKQVGAVFIWFGGSKPQYTIEVSTDTFKWTKVVDQSANSTVATPEGFRHDLPGNPARYIRLTVTGGSLYPSTMARVTELLSFGE